MRMRENTHTTEKNIFVCTFCVLEKKKGIGARLAIVLHCVRTECFGER